MKRSLCFLAAAVLLLTGAVGVLAQTATPEAPTGAATSEAAETLSEIFARLPQTRTADGGFVVGAADAPITIVEFADYACPHCQE
jgi:protein-disulfide isomerase